MDGREVDFVVLEVRRPILFLEAKLGDEPETRGLHYLKQRNKRVESWQISATGSKDYLTPDGIRVAPALVFLRRLV